ncbi:hypothetical protein K525DRAFT_192612 [Schizophyllum commune Loenen D]|nr:hypothetical protein K525DRAFT_192612 [Schizophyllum commune Loenen D]
MLAALETAMSKLSLPQGRDRSVHPELSTLIGDLERGVDAEEEELSLVLQALHSEFELPRDESPSRNGSMGNEALAPATEARVEVASPDGAGAFRHGHLAADTTHSLSGSLVKATYLSTPLRTKFFPRVSPTTLRLLLQSPSTSVESPNSSISTDSSDVAIISVLGEAPHIQGFQTATISVADRAVLEDMRVATPPSMFPKPVTKPQCPTTAMPLTPPPTGELPSVARFPSPVQLPLSPESPNASGEPEYPCNAPDISQNFSPPPTPPRAATRLPRRRPLTINVAAANSLNGSTPAAALRPFSETQPIPHAPHLSLLSPTAVSRFRRVIDEMRGVDEEVSVGKDQDEREDIESPWQADVFTSSSADSSLDLTEDEAAPASPTSPCAVPAHASRIASKSPSLIFEGHSKADARLGELADLLEERAAKDEIQVEVLYRLAERIEAMAHARREAVEQIDAFRERS